MRKSIDGLCAIVYDQISSEPPGQSIYLFCGKRCDRIKVLLHEPDGYVLLYKRLDVVKGRFRWPRDKSEVKTITWQQFDWFMSGLEIDYAFHRVGYPYSQELRHSGSYYDCSSLAYYAWLDVGVNISYGVATTASWKAM